MKYKVQSLELDGLLYWKTIHKTKWKLSAVWKFLNTGGTIRIVQIKTE